MDLSKTKVPLTFFLHDVPYRAVASSSTIIIKDHVCILNFSFPSFKSNLDMNQDGSEIMEHIKGFDTIEIFEDHFSDTLHKFITADLVKDQPQDYLLTLSLPD